MGLLFQSNEPQDLVAVVEEVAKRVEHLGLRDAQGLSDVEDRFAALVQRNDVANRHTQAVDHRFAPADAFEAHDVWVLGLNNLGHAASSTVGRSSLWEE